MVDKTGGQVNEKEQEMEYIKVSHLYGIVRLSKNSDCDKFLTLDLKNLKIVYQNRYDHHPTDENSSNVNK